MFSRLRGVQSSAGWEVSSWHAGRGRGITEVHNLRYRLPRVHLPQLVKGLHDSRQDPHPAECGIRPVGLAEGKEAGGKEGRGAESQENPRHVAPRG